MATPEGEIKKSIIDYLRIKGHFVFHHYNGGIYKKKTGSFIPLGLKGISDILGIKKASNGQFIAIEVKTDKGEVSKYQSDFLDTVRNMGGIAFVARSVDDCIKAGL